jgi:rhodanese-related sulfurtransferase
MGRILTLLAVLATAQAIPSDDAPRISQQDFKKLRAADNVIVVDTRNAEAFRQGHIPGAILLPLEGLQIWLEEYDGTVEKLKTAKKPIVAYCA